MVVETGATAPLRTTTLVKDQNGVTDIFYGRVMTHHLAQRDQHGAMKSELFSVVYTDGDEEDLDLDELNDAICFAREESSHLRKYF